MFILGGCLDAPYICMPQYNHMPHTFVCLLGVYTPNMLPILLCASVCSQRLLHVVGVVRGPLTCWDTAFTLSPYMGCLPFRLHPHSYLGFSLHWYVLGISMFYGEYFPYVGDLGVFPIYWGFGGISTWGVHMLILVHFCSSLCFTFLLWLQLLLLQLQLCLLGCHLFLQ